jgi:hypothetical protein
MVALALVSIAGCAPPPLGCENAPVLHAPESGCIAFQLEVGNDDSCPYRSATGEMRTVTGSWVRLTHPADRFTAIGFRPVSSPLPCDGAEQPGCPVVLLTRGGVAPCSCELGDSDVSSFGLDSLFVPALVAPEQDALLGPPGAVFEVSLCVEDRDAFPTCSEADGQCDGGGFLWSLGQCTCLPRCRVDADCPQPRTGTVEAHCDPMGCILSCDATDTCPDGQSCIDGPNTPGAVCMAPLFDGAP